MNEYYLFDFYMPVTCTCFAQQYHILCYL